MPIFPARSGRWIGGDIRERRPRADRSDMRHWVLMCWGLLWLAAVSSVAPADSSQPRPRGSGRVVAFWDFEDPISRVEPVPPMWFRAQDNPPERDRPGYPAWNVPSTSTDHALSGQRSVRLPTRGGSVSLMLAAGAVAALPEARYTIEARVRTEGITHARARVSARILDSGLAPVASGAVSSAPVLAEGQWTLVRLDVDAGVTAAWVQLELELLQPAQLGGSAPPGEDYEGAAYFDDVLIHQTPRLWLKSNAISGFMTDPMRPEISVRVRDLAGESLTAVLVVYDMEGDEVARRETGVLDAGRSTMWMPPLPGYGWYRAVAEVSSTQGALASGSVDFVWAPAKAGDRGAARSSFGIETRWTPPEVHPAVLEFASRARIGTIGIPLWDSPADVEHATRESESTLKLADRLLDAGHEISFIVRSIPMTLAVEHRLDPLDPLELILQKEELWKPPLARALAMFGERIRRWQFGEAGSISAVRRDDALGEIGKARTALRSLVPRPVAVAPWSIDTLRPIEQMPDAVVTALPLRIPDTEIPSLLAKPVSSAIDRSILIEAPDPEVYGRRAAAIEVTRRAVRAWEAGETRLLIREPWKRSPAEAGTLLPLVEAAVWRTISDQLSHARFVGSHPAPDGIVALLADLPGERGGLLITWNESADAATVPLRGLLARGELIASDPFGNTRIVGTESGGEQELIVGEMPVFVRGIDIGLARFRSAFTLEPAFLPARASKHTLELVINNPFNTGINGRIRIAEPEQWEITPRVVPLAIGAGKSMRVPLEFSLSSGEEAGSRDVVIEVDVSAERRYPVMRVHLPLNIGLPGVEMLPSYRFEPSAEGGVDLVVTARITNLGDRTISAELYAQAPGHRMLQAPISGIEAGDSTVRMFRFSDGAKLRGRGVRLGLRELQSAGRLNQTLVIE